MAVLLAPQVDVARRAALDPVRLGDGLRGDRVERDPLPGRIIDAVALVPVLEGNRLPRLRAVDDRVGHAVDIDAARRYLAPEVRMKMSRPAVVDKRDVARRSRVDGCRR